ncbi:MAG TPA: 50S ribosomal protein L9 [Smithella sp.]|jgi:large subunit ribosomal protein L9|nr:50S ribosomal protein L9 [Smithella sp.]
MKVILKQSVPSLGKAGALIKVNDGYARNFLIPKGLATEANEKNIKLFEHDKTNILKKAAKEQKSAQALADALSNVTITMARKVGDQDKIFGSVTTKDIESALKEKGYDIDRKMIVHEHGEHIKSLGEFKIKIKLAADVETEIKLIVTGEPRV